MSKQTMIQHIIAQKIALGMTKAKCCSQIH
jgi:hypothetical protein